MPIRVPQKGSIEWIKLAETTLNPAYQDAELGVRHVGAKAARAWSLRAMAIQSAERQRQAAVAETERQMLTVDGVTEWADFVDGVFAECVAELRNVEGVSGEAAAKEFASDMSVAEMMLTFYAILRMQSLTQPEIFTSDPGVVPPG